MRPNNLHVNFKKINLKSSAQLPAWKEHLVLDSNTFL